MPKPIASRARSWRSTRRSQMRTCVALGKHGCDATPARGVASPASLAPPEAGRKVMVVLQADRMRVEAADVLLKVLEEPPTDTVFQLLSARPDGLPDTVRSRCQ